MTSPDSGVLLSLALISSLSIIGTLCLTANAFKFTGTDKVLDFINDNGSPSTTEDRGKRWALLIAGSSGYGNYRHQADVCHAYQILKRGGLKDENIIVFMYDDIASNPDNPRPGVIINKPDGNDVYQGVPKDYTGDQVNSETIYAAILGNKSALTGGSGKFLDSGPNDRIFIFYSDHGGPGILGMPSGDCIYAKDLIDVLKKKHAAKGYRSMVFYLEACEAGSIFEGLLPENLSIYATTASNAEESSYGTYCDHYNCLGDLYSISWMEDCDQQDLLKETLGQQYEIVRKRTNLSHVMQYGDTRKRKSFISVYMGEEGSGPSTKDNYDSPLSLNSVKQRDADLLHLKYKFKRAPTGTRQKQEAQSQLVKEIARRKNEDNSINKIGELLFGHQKSSEVLMKVRPSGQPIVDDWDCFKMFVRTYENFCGRLSTYGMKYTRAIANMCNAGVTRERMVAASNQTCSKKLHHL